MGTKVMAMAVVNDDDWGIALLEFCSVYICIYVTQSAQDNYTLDSF